MLRQRQRRFNKIIMVILAVLVVALSVVGYSFVTKMSEAKRTMKKKLTEQQEGYENSIKELEDKYAELEAKYNELQVVNEELKNNRVNLPTYNFTEEEIYMLAQCVEAEAGNYKNHAVSQRYITQVILNRLHNSKFPNTLTEVIYAKSSSGTPQFSVAYNGMMNRVVEPETLANVYSVIVHGTDLPRYVNYFYADYVTGNWVNTLNTYSVIEGTVFAYKNEEDY